MFEIAFDAWYKSVDIHILESQGANVRESGKVA